MAIVTRSGFKSACKWRVSSSSHCAFSSALLGTKEIDPPVILTNLPFALVGGAFTATVTGGNLSPRLAGWFCGPIWNYVAQLDHADFPLSAFGRVCRRNLEHEHRISQGVRAACAHFNHLLVTGLGLLP
jgi:hypothetical protein